MRISIRLDSSEENSKTILILQSIEESKNEVALTIHTGIEELGMCVLLSDLKEAINKI